MFNSPAWTLITIEVTVYKILIFPKKSLKRYIALGWVFLETNSETEISMQIYWEVLPGSKGSRLEQREMN